MLRLRFPQPQHSCLEVRFNPRVTLTSHSQPPTIPEKLINYFFVLLNMNAAAEETSAAAFMFFNTNAAAEETSAAAFLTSCLEVRVNPRLTLASHSQPPTIPEILINYFFVARSLFGAP